MIGKKIALLWLSVFLLLPVMVGAEVDTIKFTTSEQTIAPGEISGKITVQLLNSTNSPEALGVTGTLLLTSNSGSGRFSSSDSNWQNVSKLTVNSNWTSRSFYYQDEMVGRHTISVTLTGGGTDLPAEQSIVITDSNTADDDTESDEEESDDNTNNSTTTATTTVKTTTINVSCHDSQSDLTVAEIAAVKIGAGRNRLAVVGQEISWQAQSNLRTNKGSYVWTFGDGTEQAGKEVSHRYLFPGTYEVLLHAYFSDQEAVSRTTVLIAEPTVDLAELNWPAGYFMLENHGTNEINLGAWVIKCSDHHFYFPADTIITAGQVLKVPIALSGCPTTTDWQLLNPDGQKKTPALVVTEPSFLATNSLASTTAQQHARVQAAVAAARAALVTPVTDLPSSDFIASPEQVSASSVAVEPIATNTIILNTTAKKQSWWPRVKSWLGL